MLDREKESLEQWPTLFEKHIYSLPIVRANPDNVFIVPEQFFHILGRPGAPRITRRYYGLPRNGKEFTGTDIQAETSFELRNGVYVPISIDQNGENYWDQATLWFNSGNGLVKPGEIRYQGYKKSKTHPFEELIVVYNSNGEVRFISRNPGRLVHDGGSAVLSRDPNHVDISKLLAGETVEFLYEGLLFSYEVSLDQEDGQVVVRRRDPQSEDKVKFDKQVYREELLEELFDPQLLEEPWTLDTTLDRKWRGASLLRVIGGEWKSIKDGQPEE
ncbi:hypothetical protein A3G67_04360 [Candidatus Roizmanbacteria bacterium RIFCSPLOWO2_12_FULL_40_12]|nr:MAG: hypothetical protein A3G67_04360 [Candidatus Roizmanbacteria bacterium RIFCSPLOWO2_12_FULL_40_12]